MSAPFSHCFLEVVEVELPWNRNHIFCRTSHRKSGLVHSLTYISKIFNICLKERRRHQKKHFRRIELKSGHSENCSSYTTFVLYDQSKLFFEISVAGFDSDFEVPKFLESVYDIPFSQIE